MTAASDAFKARQRQHWDFVAEGWRTQAEWTDRNFRPLTEWLAQHAGLRPGGRVLDVACGAGYPAFAVAERVRPGGTVVAADLSPRMVGVCIQRARESGATDVECVEMDAEALQFPSDSFDAVTNATGLMFCPEPDRALAEAFRVLKRGGRIAVATWADIAQSPFFGVIAAVAATHLGITAAPAGASGPFRFADSGELGTMVQVAGFTDVTVAAVPMTLDCGTPDDYCRLFADVAWKTKTAALSAPQRSAFVQAVGDAAQPYLRSGRLHLTATALCAAGRK